jgi:hypothetical protein
LSGARSFWHWSISTRAPGPAPRPRGAALGRVVGRRQLAAQVEQLVLDLAEDVVEPARRLALLEALRVEDAREADNRVELVDRAVGLDAGASFGRAARRRARCRPLSPGVVTRVMRIAMREPLPRQASTSHRNIADWRRTCGVERGWPPSSLRQAHRGARDQDGGPERPGGLDVPEYGGGRLRDRACPRLSRTSADPRGAVYRTLAEIRARGHGQRVPPRARHPPHLSDILAAKPYRPDAARHR